MKLVVVAIIGLLASIVIVSLAGVRSGARDAKAQADLRQVQTAVELCYQSQIPNAYPAMPSVGDSTWDPIPAGSTITCGTRVFMDSVPTTAGVELYQWNDNPVDDSTTHYGANGVAGQDYGLRVFLEDAQTCFILTPKGVRQRAGVCP